MIYTQSCVTLILTVKLLVLFRHTLYFITLIRPLQEYTTRKSFFFFVTYRVIEKKRRHDRHRNYITV